MTAGRGRVGSLRRGDRSGKNPSGHRRRTVVLFHASHRAGRPTANDPGAVRQPPPGHQHPQQNLCSAVLREISQGRGTPKAFGGGMGKRGCGLIPPPIAFGVPRPPPAYSEDKTAGRKMGARKSALFMFLPPSFCLSLCVWPAAPTDLLYPCNPCHPWSRSFGWGLRRCAPGARCPKDSPASSSLPRRLVPPTSRPQLHRRRKPGEGVGSPAPKRGFSKIVDRKTLEISNFQTVRLVKVCFWPKSGAILQKNGGPTEIILHFFSRFSGFWGFSP